MRFLCVFRKTRREKPLIYQIFHHAEQAADHFPLFCG